VINGVILKKLRVIPDARGRLMEILRADDQIFKKFGQVYMTSVYPGIVKAWHCHRVQTDHLVAVRGMVRLALWDDREGSKTRGDVDEVCIGVHNPTLGVVPPGVGHGFEGVGGEEAIGITVPTETYNYELPDELRMDPYENDIPFDWRRRDR